MDLTQHRYHLRIQILLEAGADATGVVGEFALERAIEFGDHEMEQMLIDAGAETGAL